MVFIKKVQTGSKTYYYLVQSYRIGGTVQQKIIKRLTSIEANNPDFIKSFKEKNPGYQKSGIKAIIPAAGKSFRLFPYSQELPKGLIPVGNKPILQHAIDSLHTCGINEIILVTGFQHTKMTEMFKNEVKFLHNPFYTVSNVLASVWFAIKEMNCSLFILYSDILFQKSIINSLIQSDEDISVAVTSTTIDNEAEKVVIKDDYLTDIGKDIPYGATSYEFTGIAKFSEKGAGYLRDALEEMAQEEGFLDLYFTAVLERLLLQGHKINTITISPDLWIDIDFPKDLQRAERDILPKIKSYETE
ncbi:MAG: NTP transferase domain-containing protein [Candidatus Hodarchaeota archaeon]